MVTQIVKNNFRSNLRGIIVGDLLKPLNLEYGKIAHRWKRLI